MKTKTLAVALLAVAMLAMTAAPAVVGSHEGHQGKEKSSALVFHDLWRKLWEDHVWWTRMVIIGIFDDLGGNGNYTARLIQNYVDMENALKPFYGDDAEELGDLIQDHLVIAANILVEAKAGHNITGLVNDWYANANDIAMTMNDLNPMFWPLGIGQDLWKTHLDWTLSEAVAHLTHDWAGDVAAFDQIHAEALMMADFFSTGIIRQFPNMFTAIGHIARP